MEMVKQLNLVLVGSLLITAVHAADEVSITSFLNRLAQDHGFELQGTDLVGNDSFAPPNKVSNVEKAVARALNGYNYVVTYSNREVRRVIVLGKKGKDIGAMPEEAGEAAETEEYREPQE